MSSSFLVYSEGPRAWFTYTSCSLSQMYSSQGILYIYHYPTRPQFSLRDVFFSRYTLHVFLRIYILYIFLDVILSIPSLFLCQMYSSQGILYIYSIQPVLIFLSEVYFTTIVIQPFLFPHMFSTAIYQLIYIIHIAYFCMCL